MPLLPAGKENGTVVNMAEYRFSLTRIFPYKKRIVDYVIKRGYTGQRKPASWHILLSVGPNFFFLCASLQCLNKYYEAEGSMRLSFKAWEKSMKIY